MSDRTSPASVPLTQGQVAIVDAVDLPFLSRYNWSASRAHRGKFIAVRGFTVTVGLYRTMFMHREIMGLAYGDPLEVDHINFDTLDNRRSNLRIVTPLANKRWQPSRGGTSRFVGVTRDQPRQLWRAQIQIDGVGKNLGSYATEEEAAMVRDQYVRSHGTGHGVNFPETP